jgi:hypothetical protein
MDRIVRMLSALNHWLDSRSWAAEFVGWTFTLLVIAYAAVVLVCFVLWDIGALQSAGTHRGLLAGAIFISVFFSARTSK